MEGADRSLETLLQDSKQSLDGDMRSALVSAFLNCNPKRCPILPTFRLEELLAACTSIDRKRSGDIQTIESLLSLFTLTVYFGLTTNHDSAFTAKMIKRLYIWTTESIAIDLTMGSKFFAMSDLSTVFDRQPSIDPSNKLEIFSNSLEIAKLILRDTLTLSRDLKNPHRLRDEKQIPKNPDCVKPQTIYFMACFSLCHISLVLHSQSRISILPGLVEALLMFVLTKPALDASNAESSSQTTVSTSPLCLASKAHDLAVFSAHCVFQPRVLQDVILVRSRMARHLLQPGRSHLTCVGTC